MKLFYLSVNIANHLQKYLYFIEEVCVDLNVLPRYVLYEEHNNDIYIPSPKKVVYLEMDGYMYMILESALMSSHSFRSFFFGCLTKKNGCKGVTKINLDVRMPDQYVLDKRGNKLFEMSCLERRELDNAMAWFSTLGGAFSALGDKMEYCAIIAGKISQQQFMFALRLGDPNLVSRCKLYMALSLIQQKKFHEAKHIIKCVYPIAKKECERDKRLMSMCLGIWTKYKYDKKQAKLIEKP